MALGTLLIAGGAVLIAVFGIVPEPTHSLEDLLRLFNRPAFVAYFSILGFVVLVWLVTVRNLTVSLSRARSAVLLDACGGVLLYPPLQARGR